MKVNKEILKEITKEAVSNYIGIPVDIDVYKLDDPIWTRYTDSCVYECYWRNGTGMSPTYAGVVNIKIIFETLEYEVDDLLVRIYNDGKGEPFLKGTLSKEDVI